MSLTRKEWEEVWNSIKKVENYINFKSSSERKNQVKIHVDFIKNKIQQVIGQME